MSRSHLAPRILSCRKASILVKDADYTLAEEMELCRVHDASVGHQKSLQRHTRRANAHPCCVTGIKIVHPLPSVGNAAPRAIGPRLRACPSRQRDSTAQHRGRSGSPQRGRGRGRGRGRSSSRRSNRHRQTQVDAIDDAPHSDEEDEIAYHAVHITIREVSQRESAYATLDVQLPNKQHHDTLRLKVDTNAEGNILPLRIFRRMYPRKLDASGNPKREEVRYISQE